MPWAGQGKSQQSGDRLSRMRRQTEERRPGGGAHPGEAKLPETFLCQGWPARLERVGNLIGFTFIFVLLWFFSLLSKLFNSKKDNLKEGNYHCEYHPNVNHLDIGCGQSSLRDPNEAANK